MKESHMLALLFIYNQQISTICIQKGMNTDCADYADVGEKNQLNLKNLYSENNEYGLC